MSTALSRLPCCLTFFKKKSKHNWGVSLQKCTISGDIVTWRAKANLHFNHLQHNCYFHRSPQMLELFLPKQHLFSTIFRANSRTSETGNQLETTPLGVQWLLPPGQKGFSKEQIHVHFMDSRIWFCTSKVTSHVINHTAQPGRQGCSVQLVEISNRHQNCPLQMWCVCWNKSHYFELEGRMKSNFWDDHHHLKHLSATFSHNTKSGLHFQKTSIQPCGRETCIQIDDSNKSPWAAK